jgi:putative endonuclease
MARSVGRPGGLTAGADAARKAAGARGEELAARHLTAKGYRILARNYRCALGEIDLVAAQGECVAFVEVKTLRGHTAYHPALAVDRRKQKKLKDLAQWYLSEHPSLNLQPRFDVVAVTLSAPRPTVEHIENAF